MSNTALPDAAPVLFELRPFIAIWEMTQACDLACLHCRASARPGRDAGELTTDEGKALLERLRSADVPLVVLTGGDPAKRSDLVELVAHGTQIGLRMALTPSATPRVTPELVRLLAGAGLVRIAVSIDGADAPTHDNFRGVGGSFEQSLKILSEARARGISGQVNTSVHAASIGQLARIAELVRSTESALWSVFYLVPTGRANASMLPTANEVETSLIELARIADAAPFAVKTTAAPHYRRVLLQRRRLAARAAPLRGEAVMPAGESPRPPALRVNDGRGILFVSHRGEIFPSGFLPVTCGSVRKVDPIQVYRHHPTFRALRDASSLTGKCGACEYRNVCGGSRARAYAMTGSVLGSDPLCAYVPPAYREPDSDRRSAARALRVVCG